MTLLERLRHASAEAVLVRFGAAVAALTALLMAMPDVVRSQHVAMAALVVLAALVGLAPRGPFATVAVLVTVAGWLADTGWTGESVAAGEVLALAAVLYLVHSLTTLAAALPIDAQVGPGVVVWWILRAAVVVLITSLLSVAVITAVSATTTGVSQVATVVGLLVAAGLATLLAFRARPSRRPQQGSPG